ncbi:MAG: hypothetical protein CME70_02180 [Halobacteriovorax sp.]|nr:hypothetical protein [Halobacteriovorax sp.]|tara:strand:+ start:50682 stop:51458 length:777 start_codon:yes stop_codon:yes gene_type:complete
MKIAVLGCGNLATAVVSKLEGFEFHTYTPSYIRAEELAKLKNGTAYKELKNIPLTDFVILGMKPQQFEEFAKVYKDFFDDSSVVISLLAGTSTDTIKKALGAKSVARVMSNTPAIIGKGLHALYFSNVDQSSVVESMFKVSGETIVLDSEDKIDGITHFSGSGPAYLFDLARILTSELEKRGLTNEQANMAIKQTLLGSAELLKNSELPAIELRKQVTSKAGVTEKVLESLWDFGIDNAYEKALIAGDERIAQLKGII